MSNLLSNVRNAARDFVATPTALPTHLLVCGHGCSMRERSFAIPYIRIFCIIMPCNDSIVYHLVQQNSLYITTQAVKLLKQWEAGNLNACVWTDEWPNVSSIVICYTIDGFSTQSIYNYIYTTEKKLVSIQRRGITQL